MTGSAPMADTPPLRSENFPNLTIYFTEIANFGPVSARFPATTGLRAAGSGL